MSDVNTEKSIVVRIAKKDHKRAKAIKGKQTFVEFFSSSLDTIECLADREPLYIVGDKVFQSLPLARGEAIKRAAEANLTDWELPYIAVILGQDTGEA